MPKKPLIRSGSNPYHVTGRCNNKEPFYADLEKVWRIFSFELNEITSKHFSKTHAFVLMPNHFHLLISTPADDLGVVMRTFMAAVTRNINSETGRSGRVFGAKYHWSLIGNANYYDCALKYVYRNPVKAKLVSKAEDYPFSTLRSFLSKPTENNILIQPPIGVDSDIPDHDLNEFLNWINESFKNEQEDVIKKALRKKEFSPPKEGWKKKRIHLESYLNPKLCGEHTKDTGHL